nr:winged helix-turn-helix domain-containing protein [Micromonospora sp. DSM 115978]
MLRIHFTAEDLARTTLAAEPDPLWEVLLSLHMAQSNGGQVVFGDWRRCVGGATASPELALLRELAPPVGYSPDFLTPANAGPSLDEALDRLLATPRSTVRAELEYLATRRGSTPSTRTLATASADAMRRLGRAVRSYYEFALGPYWQSIRQHVAADRVRRMQTWTSGGVDRLLSTLHPRTDWNPPVLEIRDFVDTEVHLDGRGLTLQPSFFCWQVPTKLRNTGLSPILVYPTQPPPGTLARRRQGQRAGLVALLGRTRADALHATVSGCTTNELARLCGVSPAAASQQATVLREAALITTRRDGGAVRHEITALGLSLLNSADLPV